MKTLYMAVIETKPVSDGMKPVLLDQKQTLNLVSRASDIMLNIFTPDGLPASVDRRFNHIFARDTAIAVSFVDDTPKTLTQSKLWDRSKAAVLSFWGFQRPNGSFPHEVKKHSPSDRLVKQKHFYQEGEYSINEDSIDATPLMLIATALYVPRHSFDFETILPKAQRALLWMMDNMDENNGWLSYRYNKLTQQGWMDSKYSVTYEDETLPEDPISLVEVQAFAWKTFQNWSDILRDVNPDLSRELKERAVNLKKRFNDEFLIADDRGIYFAQALDGKGDQIRSRTINPGLCLWASYKGEAIIDDAYIPPIVERLTSSGFFDEEAGIRTFERGQNVHDPEGSPDGGYHKGENVFWPFATAMVAKGMLDLGYVHEGKKVLRANMKPVLYFGSFIETFNRNGTYKLYANGERGGSTKNQTWTIAEFLWTVNHPAMRNTF